MVASPTPVKPVLVRRWTASPRRVFSLTLVTCVITLVVFSTLQLTHVANWRHSCFPVLESLESPRTGNKSRSPHISIDFKGRLGNQMFIYASLIGISNMTSHTAIIPPGIDLFGDFPIIAQQTSICDHPYSKSKTYISFSTYRAEKEANIVHTDHEEEPGIRDDDLIQRLLTVHTHSDVVLGGYFQSYKYFEHISPTVRHHFSFRPKLLESALSYLAHLKSYYSVQQVIGVHIRREDYVLATDGRAMADAAYLRRAISYLTNGNSGVVSTGDDTLFLFCSTPDGLEWSEKTMSRHLPQYKVAYSIGRTPVEDLALLVNTDHLILSVGSYGWWAGYLGRGQVVYMRQMAKMTVGGKSGFITGYKMDDYFPPHWVAL